MKVNTTMAQSTRDLEGRTAYRVDFTKDDDEDPSFFIGMYSSQERASQVVARLRSQPGFIDYPEGFSILAVVIDDTSWADGYVE